MKTCYFLRSIQINRTPTPYIGHATFPYDTIHVRASLYFISKQLRSLIMSPKHLITAPADRLYKMRSLYQPSLKPNNSARTLPTEGKSACEMTSCSPLIKPFDRYTENFKCSGKNTLVKAKKKKEISS